LEAVEIRFWQKFSENLRNFPSSGVPEGRKKGGKVVFLVVESGENEILFR